MTPTREQVAAWIAQADAYASSQTSDFQEHGEIAAERFATLAMSAGRDQGLQEAREVCDEHKAGWSENAKGYTSGMYDHMADAAEQCAAAIEQLRACGSAATPG